MSDKEPTESEMEEFRREMVIEDITRTGPEEYPALHNFSAAFAYRAVPRATNPEVPEYVTVPFDLSSPSTRDT